MFDEQDGLCATPDCPNLAEELDHIDGWQAGDHRDNVQGLCVPCHERKTQQEAARGHRTPTQPR